MSGLSKKPVGQATLLGLSFKSLLLALVMCALAGAAVVGVQKFARTIEFEEAKSASDLAAAQLALQNTQTDRARLEENLQLFEKLKKNGFVTKADRLRILEVLENASQRMRRVPINWELAPQQLQKTLTDEKTNTTVAQLVRVPMKLSAGGIHEEEWSSLLESLQNKGAGYYLLDNCSFNKIQFASVITTVPAINAECNLSWLYMEPTLPNAKPP